MSSYSLLCFLRILRALVSKCLPFTIKRKERVKDECISEGNICFNTLLKCWKIRRNTLKNMRNIDFSRFCATDTAFPMKEFYIFCLFDENCLLCYASIFPKSISESFFKSLCCPINSNTIILSSIQF